MALEINEIGCLEDNSPMVVLSGTHDEIKRVAKMFGQKVDVVLLDEDAPEKDEKSNSNPVLSTYDDELGWGDIG